VARQAGIVGQNTFLKGLITDVSALSFPPDACTDTNNCIFDRYGKSRRRLGLQFEDGATQVSDTFDATYTYTEYLWEAVSGRGNISLLVQQIGHTLHFFDASANVVPSANKKSFTVNLTTYKAAGGAKAPEAYPCVYASGNGDLIVTNPACDVLLIQYNVSTNDITTTIINVKERDLYGLADGLRVNERPTETVATLKSNNPRHYYNIINQSWYIADALSQWDTARTDMPSNADMVSYYRSASTTTPDAFDNANVTAFDPGSTPAAKGHFILSITNPNRTTAASAEGFTGFTLPVGDVIITGGTPNSWNIANQAALTNPTLWYNNVTTATFANSTGTTATLGIRLWRDFTSAQQCSKVIVYGSSDQGFVTGANPSVTLTLYGKNTADVSATSLGTLTFTDTADESAGRTVTSSDTTTRWDKIYVELTCGTTQSMRIAEARFYYSAAGDEAVFDTVERPSCCAFYTSRAFYAGIDYDSLSSNIYFTRIIKRSEDYEKAYQQNDPTSEQSPDLLPDDGGVIRIPEMGRCVALFSTQSSLIVMATNGIWVVSGSSGSAFTASDYRVKRISEIGMNSPLSVLNVGNIPMWWGYDGIYTVQYDANYEAFTPVNVTLPILNGFYEDISAQSKMYVKAAYDRFRNIGYWLYGDGTPYSYNKVLVIDGVTKAFYPWEYEVEAVVPKDVKGIVFYADATSTGSPSIKYTVATPSTNEISYAETRASSYLDWDELDYSSYFVTGYRLDGKTLQFFQNNYVMIFFDQEANSSCYVQGIYDWSTDPSNGKWSTSQQAYSVNHLGKSVSYRRLKIRGKGRSAQLRFYSETGKPFNIIGWAIKESMNADV